MPDGSSPKLHHFVPQAYLRGFASEQDRVAVVPLDADKAPFVSAVRNVAAQTHFYRLEESSDPDGFERFLSGLEGAAMEVIRRVESDYSPLSENDRLKLAQFVALQSVRGPDTRRTMEADARQLIRLQVGANGKNSVDRFMDRESAGPHTADERDRFWEEVTQVGGPRLGFSNGAHIRFAIELANSLVPYIFMRPWIFFHFERRALITSDSPVGLIECDDTEPWEGVGFATARAITLPLSRRAGLYMKDPMDLLDHPDTRHEDVLQLRDLVINGKADLHLRGNTGMERILNSYTTWCASEYLYCHPEDRRFVPESIPPPRLLNADFSGLDEWRFGDEPILRPARPERRSIPDGDTE